MALGAIAALIGSAASRASVGAAVGVASAASTVKDASDAMADASFGVIVPKKQWVTRKSDLAPYGEKVAAETVNRIDDRTMSLTKPKATKNAVSNASGFGASVTPNKVTARKAVADVSGEATGVKWRATADDPYSIWRNTRDALQNIGIRLPDPPPVERPSGVGTSELTTRKVKLLRIDPLTGKEIKEFSTSLPWAPGFVDTTPTIGERTSRTASGWLYGDDPRTAENENPNGKTFGEFLMGIFSNENANKPTKPSNAVPDKEFDWQRVLGSPAALPLLREYNGEDAGIAKIPMPVIDDYQLGSDAPKAPRRTPDVWPFLRPGTSTRTVTVADASSSAPIPMSGRPASIDRKVAPTPFPAYLADDNRLGRGGGETADGSWFSSPAPLTVDSMNTLGAYDGQALPSGPILPGDPDYDPTFTGTQIRVTPGPGAGSGTGTSSPGRSSSTTPPSGLSNAPWVTGERGDTPLPWDPAGSGNGTLPGPGLGLIDLQSLDWWKQAGAGLLVLLVIGALLVYGVRKTLGD